MVTAILPIKFKYKDTCRSTFPNRLGNVWYEFSKSPAKWIPFKFILISVMIVKFINVRQCKLKESKLRLQCGQGNSLHEYNPSATFRNTKRPGRHSIRACNRICGHDKILRVKDFALKKYVVRIECISNQLKVTRNFLRDTEIWN